MSAKDDDEARDALADLILSAEHPDLKRYLPEKRGFRLNFAQTVFLWIVAAVSLLAIAGGSQGDHSFEVIILIASVLAALSYRRVR